MELVQLNCYCFPLRGSSLSSIPHCRVHIVVIIRSFVGVAVVATHVLYFLLLLYHHSLSVYVVLHFHCTAAVNGSCAMPQEGGEREGVWHCLSTANCKLKLGELLTVKTVPIVLLSLSSLMLTFYCRLARFQIIATGNIDNMFVFTAWKCVWKGGGRGACQNWFPPLVVAFNVFAVVSNLLRECHAMLSSFPELIT